MKLRLFEASDGWIRAVPTGFSWLAFFFGPLWAFANRGWLLGILLAAVTLPLKFFEGIGASAGPALAGLSFLVSLSFLFLSGRYGRKWLIWSLKRQGYKEVEAHVV